MEFALIVAENGDYSESQETATICCRERQLVVEISRRFRQCGRGLIKLI